MATKIPKWIFITILLSVATKREILIQGEKQVRCLFFFGDSLLDNGNNNNLITMAKVNYRPYGIDYPVGPTGRFSNGRNIADSFAKLLGFNGPIPPFATTVEGPDLLRGVNYASGVGGILDVTGIQVGDRISLNRQLQNHQVTIRRIARVLGNLTAADAYLRQCLYVINIGNEDYVNNYYFPLSPTPLLYSPAKFADLLTQTFSQQLRRLHDLGSRKVVIFGLTTLGCIPQEVKLYGTNGRSPCVDSINNAVELYNNKLASVINFLNIDLPDATFTYVNITDLSSANSSATGTTVNNAPCCEVGITGLCAPNGTPCTNRNAYYYWDNYHPTDFIYNRFALRAYNTVPSP